MGKRRRRKVFLAQNYLRSPGLVRRLVARSSIGPGDVVYEIGPGRGIITAELARAAKRVVAVEKDPELVRRLRERFRAVENVEIIEQDFLRFPIRERDYKIFANIPYSITASIVRKILYAPPTPSEAYLILQKEPARKFAGRPRETLFSLLAKPCFEFQVVAGLKRTDFDPVPDVDSVLLRVARRRAPVLQKEDAALYREFVQYGFGRWKRYLRLAFKRVFTYRQWKCLSQELRFPLNATPTELTFEQWLGLFKAFKRRLALTDRTTGLNRQ
jgi:23S rRNA (adenine-N6)-dimethyltransferase